jgi:hypothetical protein
LFGRFISIMTLSDFSTTYTSIVRLTPSWTGPLPGGRDRDLPGSGQRTSPRA